MVEPDKQSLSEQWATAASAIYGDVSKYAGHTLSGIPLSTVYGPDDVEGIDDSSIGFPGVYPYTRGIYPLQYQAVPWMNQMVHGFGTPEDTNERMRTLRAEGMAGYGGRPVFNLVFDLPTQEGFDADDPVAVGRVGQSGVSVSTVDDLDRVFAGFELSGHNASLIMADPSIAIVGMYVVLAERRGVDIAELRGNTMNFLYNTFHMDRHGFPPRSAMRLIVDLIKFTSENMPKWNSTNLCGYNIRQSGSNATQELAYTMATSIAITEACVASGLDPDAFLPRFGFQMCADNDLFEEIAKLRALRRMWASINAERFGAKKPSSLQARIHVHTSGASLTAQQPPVNIVRAALQTLGAVLGGANSIQTSAFDEALSIPTEEAAVLALRTQQVIANETGVTAVSDPLGGSFYLEWLTDRLIAEAWGILEELEHSGGGYMAAWESGWLRERIAAESYRDRERVDRGERVIVGVNRFLAEEESSAPIFSVSEEAERSQLATLSAFRAKRDTDAAIRSQKALAEAVHNGLHLMPFVLDCFRADSTLGEVMGVFRDAWGRGSIY
jgi:methylmalonyl-CoA mutase N-terminal domain/subunit